MIELRDLSFSHGARPVLSGAAHTFVAGESTAIVGRSGAGKSTVLYLIGLMLTPDSGLLRVGGVDAGRLSDGARSALRAETFGFVFQDALLDPARTVLHNVLQGALYRRRRAGAEDAGVLLTRFGVPEESWRRRPGQVSGGQAQRVALCRALIGAPPVILADEPTGNLDPETADTVWAALGAAAGEGATVIVATHDPSRAASCDRVLRVRDGLLA